MAKQGMHHHDHHDQDVSRGPNKHEQSQTITTGSYKKQGTYKEQALHHKNPAKQAQAAENEWHQASNPPSAKDRGKGHRRSGSESNAS